jgi:hypothetical protein
LRVITYAGFIHLATNLLHLNLECKSRRAAMSYVIGSLSPLRSKNNALEILVTVRVNHIITNQA